MKERRLEKFRRVAAMRQPDLTVILENVTDPHNIGAVMRTCDAVGIREMYVLNTEPHLQTETIVIGNRTSMGTRKWVDIQYFTDIDLCFRQLRAKYGQVFGTSLGEDAKDIYQLDFAEPMALLFGNEHSGLSEMAKERIDGNFLIPQIGMAESLNISVACAVTLYEAFRQRKSKGFFDPPYKLPLPEQEALFQTYLDRHESGPVGRLEVRRTVN